MGFNSAIMICNDAMHEIEKDPVGWWKKANSALNNISRTNDGVFGFGSHSNYFQAICNHHADQVSIVAIGGNRAQILGHGNWNDTPEVLLKKLADELGYSLSKKRQPKKK